MAVSENQRGLVGTRLPTPGLVLVVVASIVAVIFAVLGFADDSSPSIDSIEAEIADTCDGFRHGKTLLVAVLPGHSPSETDCVDALRSAAINAEFPQADVDGIFGNPAGGSVTANGLRFSMVVLQFDEPDTTWFVEFADCDRILVPTNRDAWSAGIPWERIWSSACVGTQWRCNRAAMRCRQAGL